MTTTRHNGARPSSAPQETGGCPAQKAAGSLKWIRDRWAENKAVRLDTPNGSATYTWTRRRAEAQTTVKNPTPPFETDEAGVLWMNHRRTRLRITHRWRITASEQTPRHRHRHTAATRHRMKIAGGADGRRRKQRNAGGRHRAAETRSAPKKTATEQEAGTETTTDAHNAQEARR